MEINPPRRALEITNLQDEGTRNSPWLTGLPYSITTLTERCEVDRKITAIVHAGKAALAIFGGPMRDNHDGAPVWRIDLKTKTPVSTPIRYPLTTDCQRQVPNTSTRQLVSDG